MKLKALALFVCSSLLVAGAATAADKVDMGRSEYDVYCAVCHGVTGRGDGPYKVSLSKAPSDLTLLQRKNSGTYPFDRIYEVIDGRVGIAAHGTREMPIWGRRYTARAADYYVDVPYDPEVYARGRILAVTEYVYRLQMK